MLRLASTLFTQLLLATAALAAGALENPQPGSTQSGIALISGWNCNATQITVRIDGAAPIIVPYGAPRADTRTVCGRIDTGFGLLVNFNVLGTGSHTISALADGVQFQAATFNVVTLGQEFVSGASGTAQVTGFPDSGRQVTLQWQESKQNFSITGVAPVAPAGRLDGTYRLVRSSVDFLGSQVLDTTLGNVDVTGTMVIGNNTATQNYTITVGGQTQNASVAATFTDLGAYLLFTNGTGGTSRVVVVQRSPLLILELIGAAIGSLPPFSEIDQWALQSKSTEVDASLQRAPVGPAIRFGSGVADAMR
jgi:hypothetical protein